MLRFWTSNRLEALVDRLARGLLPAEFKIERVLEPRRLIVPNRNIATYLRQQIALRAGIAANLEFLFLEEFLATLSVAETRLLDRAALRGLLLERFHDDAPLPLEVERYLAVDGPAGRGRRAAQLSAELARIFEGYGYSRREILDAWREGRSAPAPFDEANLEPWQRALWSALFKTEALGQSPWRWPFELADDASERLPPGESVRLFGFSYIAPSLLKVLSGIAQRAEVEVFTFLPSIACLPRPGGATRVAAGAGAEKLLRLWTDPGGEYLQLAESLKARFDEEFRPVPTEQTLLGRIQGDLLRGGSAEIGETMRPRLDRPDGSLRLLACPDPEREAQIIADEIWKLIHEDDASGPSGRRDRLRFHQIAVIVADRERIGAYQSKLRAAFVEAHDIPHHVVDGDARAEGLAVDAARRLLEFPLGRFTRREVLDLLTHPMVLARFPEIDPDAARRWCEELGVRFGRDRADLAGTYLEGERFHWDQALARLALGSCLEDRAPTETFALGPDREYLPLAVEGDSLRSAAALVAIVRSLFEDLRHAAEARMSLEDWSRFFARLLSTYLEGRDEAEERRLAACRAAVESLADLDVSGRPVGFAAAAECALERLADAPIARGHYLADGVSISSFREMRPIPFRVVFLCGLGEGHFPAAERPDPLDLRSLGRKAGDVSPRQRDQYLFLETLVSTQDRLYLSYVARDAETGESLEPSSILQELKTCLEEAYLTEEGIGEWESQAARPLRRFDDRYFAPQTVVPALSTYSAAGFREWSARELGKLFLGEAPADPNGRAKWLRERGGPIADWLGLCPIPEIPPVAAEEDRAVVLTVSQLRRFLECPLQGWARTVLGLSANEEGTSGDADDEPYQTPPILEAGPLKQALVDRLRSEDSAESFLEIDRRMRPLFLRGWTPSGVFRDAEREKQAELLAAWESGARKAAAKFVKRIRAERFGPAEEGETPENAYPAVEVSLSLPGATGGPVRVQIVGATEPASIDWPGSIVLARKSAGPCHLLRGYVDALLFHASGMAKKKGWRIVVLGPRKPDPEFDLLLPPRTNEEARSILQAIALDLLGGPHAYFLPFELTWHAYAADPPAALVDALEALEAKRTTFTSRYGPVPYPASYPIPDDKVARALAERRYGWLLAANEARSPVARGTKSKRKKT